MRELSGTLELAETEQPARDLRLLIAPEPWSRVFLQNLRELFRLNAAASLHPEFTSASFWPDVFVERGLPWGRFLQSGAYHVLALALIWAGSRFLALQPHVIPQPTFTHADVVVYYDASESLPPLDTRRSTPAPARPADPEYSAQPIISVPPEADNHSQTIVAPPNVKLQRDVPMPNVVAWPDQPQIPIAPAPVVLASQTSRLPRVEQSVIAPPPELKAASREALQAPQSAVIAPPPALEAGSTRRTGDLNVAHTSVIAPAPQLSLGEQRALPGRSTTALSSRTQVIAPPPSVGASAGSRSTSSMIALSLHPAVGAPPESPAGNRRGNFAATPEGRRASSGTAGASPADKSAGGANSGNGKASESAANKKSSNGLPSGLYVGKSSAPPSPVAGEAAPKESNSYSVNPNLIASARPPRVSARALQPESESKLSEVERAVFGNRKFYSLSLNMPNLNSAGGSWIIRFAAVKTESSPADSYPRVAAGNASSGGSPPDDLSAPSATRKVDPAYPLELMRQNLGGTVILYAVIHADGTVGNIRVLRSVDERLDRFASEAIAKWRFQPATKNGTPVDVEATFWIPFKPARMGSNF
jgi:TonB family protein